MTLISFRDFARKEWPPAGQSGWAEMPLSERRVNALLVGGADPVNVVTGPCHAT